LSSDSVLFEDNHVLAVVKPAGLLTVGDRTGDITLLELARQYVKTKYGKPGNVFLGVVHRLDRPVSGVVVFARTGKAASRLSEQFRRGSVEKVYHAWVAGRPPKAAGTLEDLLVKDHARNVVRTESAGTPNARYASLHFRTLRRGNMRTLLEIRLETGRSHQIRVQLAARGMPIVGDVKYGGPRADLFGLHAAELTFQHPVTHQAITLRAAEPRDWKEMRV
jgi:23S rRNA pseudouridine1911/1915/1917 synthase